MNEEDPDFNEVWYPFSVSLRLVEYFGRNTLIDKKDAHAAYKTGSKKPQDYSLDAESVPAEDGSRPGVTRGLVINTKIVFGGKTSYATWRDSGGNMLEFAYKKCATDVLEQSELKLEKVWAITKWVDDYHQYLAPHANGSPRWREAKRLSKSQKALTKKLGATMTGKDFDTFMVVLGHILDSAEMVASLTQQRIEYLLQLLAYWLAQKFIRLKQLQKLAGRLRFATEVMEAAKVHMLPFQNLIGKLLRIKSKSAEIPSIVRTVMKWFQATLSSPLFTGRRLLSRDSIKVAIKGLVSSDAAFSGEGFYWNDQYYFREWPENILKLAQRTKTKSINFLEAWTTVDMVSTFREQWKGKKVVLRCDNQSWCFAHTNSKTRCEYLLALLLVITHMTTIYDIHLIIEHIRGVDNVDSDDLSRLHIQEFLERHPNAQLVKLKKWLMKPPFP
jgi:hypothetical protein